MLPSERLDQFHKATGSLKTAISLFLNEFSKNPMQYVEEKEEATKDTVEGKINKFIIKWCGSNVHHLLDSDDNDGQYLRESVKEAITAAKLQGAEEKKREVREALKAYFRTAEMPITTAQILSHPELN